MEQMTRFRGTSKNIDDLIVEPSLADSESVRQVLLDLSNGNIIMSAAQTAAGMTDRRMSSVRHRTYPILVPDLLARLEDEGIQNTVGHSDVPGTVTVHYSRTAPLSTPYKILTT